MADNMYVPAELYKNFVPGLLRICVAKNVLAQLSVELTARVGSGSCPTDMLRRFFTVSSARYGLTVSGKSPGKKETTLSFKLNLPSLTAKPTAVAVKLLLTEYIVCFKSAR